MNINHVNTKEEAIDWIHSLKTFGIKPGLTRMEWMLDHLKHPERHVKFVHIAGTNGKGSTASYISQVLIRSSYKVGLFTSPYLMEFTNRIQVNGIDISGEHLVELVNKVMPLAKELGETELGYPTEFEILTIIAILYFGTIAYPDIVVWETGLGGRLDSTNVVFPLVSVITNIGFDHMDLLGHDIKEIASEKAGIIKSGIPVVSSIEIEEARDVMKSVAQSKRATVYQLNEEFFIDSFRSTQEGNVFNFRGPYLTMPDIELRMIGNHQIKNAATALMALEILRQFYAFYIDEDAVYSGMKHTFWAGRFEKLSEKPTVIIDGAHNPEGARSLKEAINLFEYERLIMVTGILKDKAIQDFYKEIVPIADELIITEPEYGRAAGTAEVVKIIHSVDEKKEIKVIKNYQEAVEYALAIAKEDDIVVCTGSLYLISDIRRYYMKKHNQNLEKVEFR